MDSPQVRVSNIASIKDLFAAKGSREYIGKRAVLVIVINTNNFNKELDFLYDHISQQERVYLHNIPIESKKPNYLIHKSILRILISNFTGLPAKVIDFDISNHGKPSLAIKNNLLDLRFNLSHSDNLVMYAFTEGAELGIDIEEQETRISNLEVAELVLSEMELSELRSLLVSAQMPAFIKLWTKKEAISKALGLGLSIDFKQLSIGIDDRCLMPFLTTHRMAFFDLTCLPQYFASLAISYAASR